MKLEELGRGMDRLFRERDKRLNAEITKHFKGMSLGQFEDNKTRMEATKLLADILGLRKSQLDVNHGLQSGTFGVLVVPGTAPSKDDWAKNAADYQSKLNGDNDSKS